MDLAGRKHLPRPAAAFTGTVQCSARAADASRTRLCACTNLRPLGQVQICLVSLSPSQFFSIPARETHSPEPKAPGSPACGRGDVAQSLSHNATRSASLRARPATDQSGDRPDNEPDRCRSGHVSSVGSPRATVTVGLVRSLGRPPGVSSEYFDVASCSERSRYKILWPNQRSYRSRDLATSVRRVAPKTFSGRGPDNMSHWLERGGT